MITTTRSPRRTAEQWQALLDQQSNSGLTAPKFCKAENIAYQSFMSWRKKLASKVRPATDSEPTQPTFIELTADSNSEHDQDSPWRIELDLAPGVQLRIAR